MTQSTPHYDIAIIGGGINGAGIARDAAMRGLKVLLLEQFDFGSGTSSWSSRLIHGGLRYLEYGEIPLVFESLHERRRLRHLAPHLVDRICINIPIFRDSRRSKLIIRIGMLVYDLLSLGKKIPSHKMLSRDELLNEEPGLYDVGLIGGAQYYDAQVTFAERLVLENILAAQAAGADVRNYSPVIGINVRQGSVHTLQYLDYKSDVEAEISARVVINAGGPWVDQVLSTVNRRLPTFMGGTKGSHIVVGPFHGAPNAAFYVEAKADGRPFFIIPWNKQYLIGTTDIRYEGDPGDVEPSLAEVEYLLSETNRVFPRAQLEIDDVNFAYAGVRPLPKRDKGPESAITRKHIIHKHKREALGLVSVIGGKLTTYRNLAEQVVDLAAKWLRCDQPCSTRTTPLPGALGLTDAKNRLLESSSLSAECRTRLLSIYGARAAAVIEKNESTADIMFIDAEKTILASEVSFAVHDELAASLVDITHRRLMVGFRPDQGAALDQSIAALAAAEFGWDSAETKSQLLSLESYRSRFSPQLKRME